MCWLVFIDLGTRRVHFAGCTDHPTSAWVTQQARQGMWEIADHGGRDTKFTASFDSIFWSEAIHVIRTPVRAPNANGYAERRVRSVREECLDKASRFPGPFGCLRSCSLSDGLDGILHDYNREAA